MAEIWKRTAVDHPAQIYNNGMSIGCSVANISADGAAIDVPDACHVPIGFDL